MIKTEKTNNSENERKMIKQERFVKNYQRNFRFNEDVEFEKIDADFENGILKLTIPKPAEVKQKERIIKVK